MNTRRFFAIFLIALAVCLAPWGGPGLGSPHSVEAADEEPTAEVVAWMRCILDRTESADPRVRRGVYLALNALGESVIRDVISSVPSVDHQPRWRRLRILMSRVAGHKYADEIEKLKSTWPPKRVRRLASLVADLRANQPESVQVAREILDRLRVIKRLGRRSLRVYDLVKCGREVVPILIEELQKSCGAPGSADEAAALALADLITDKEVPAIARLLAGGCGVAATALRSVHSDEARDALLIPFKQGDVYSVRAWGLVPALSQYLDDESVRAAVLDHLRAGVRGGRYHQGVVDLAVQGRIYAAADFLRALLKHSKIDAEGKWYLFVALVGLGDPEGVRGLVEFLSPANLRKQGGELGDHSSSAADRLNVISETSTYVRDILARSDEGNIDQAARDFQLWWKNVAGKLRFDRKTRKWLVGAR